MIVSLLRERRPGELRALLLPDDAVVAPSIVNPEDGRAILARKANLRVVTSSVDRLGVPRDARSILGGVLVQERDVGLLQRVEIDHLPVQPGPREVEHIADAAGHAGREEGEGARDPQESYRPKGAER